MIFPQVAEISVNVTSNSPSQDYTHLDDSNLSTEEAHISSRQPAGVTPTTMKIASYFGFKSDQNMTRCMAYFILLTFGYSPCGVN